MSQYCVLTKAIYKIPTIKDHLDSINVALSDRVSAAASWKESQTCPVNLFLRNTKFPKMS